MDIIIRRAVETDCPRMMELIHELAIFERAPDAVTVSFEHFVDSGFGQHPVWWAWVAETTNDSGNNVLVGFALCYTRYSTWKGQRMYLEDILVTEQMRRYGIGKLLFDQLILEAREKGFQGISWQVLDWNEPAIQFYEKMGNVTFEKGWWNCMIDF